MTTRGENKKKVMFMGSNTRSITILQIIDMLCFILDSDSWDHTIQAAKHFKQSIISVGNYNYIKMHIHKKILIISS